jgi:hypothetical protein
LGWKGFLTCLWLYKQLFPISLGETGLMYVLPSFSLILRSIYHISARVKRTKLVNPSISLLARDPPSIV